MNKLVIFDMDGVIFDTTQIASENMFPDFPQFTHEVHLKMLEGNFHQEMTNFKQLHNYKDPKEDELKKRQQTFAEKKSHASIFPGMRELLENLHKQGYILVLNTSAWERNTLPLLEKNNVLGFFDYLATAEVSKDKIEKFKLIEQRYNSTNESSVFITDTLGDLKEAAQVGIKTICVTWGAHTRDYFLRETFDNLFAITKNSNELIGAIQKYFKS